MAKDTGITYSIVKGMDINSAMKASGLSTSAKLKMDRNDSVVWDQTVVTIMSLVDLDTLPIGTEKEDIQKVGSELKIAMAKEIMKHIVIPERGKDRAGKDFAVCDKDGIPKWSSWDQSRRIWAYLGDVAKVICFEKVSELYPEENKVGARCDVLKLCKVAEEVMAGVQRLTKDLQDRLDVVSGPEVVASHALVSALMVNNLDPVEEMKGLISKLDGLLSACDDDEKAEVRSALGTITKHFA